MPHPKGQPHDQYFKDLEAYLARRKAAAGVAPAAPCGECGLVGRHYDECPHACGVATDGGAKQ